MGSTGFRRIDRFIVATIRWLWKWLVRCWNHVRLWWRYTFREPLADPDQANEALRDLCGYKVQISTETKLKCCLPGFYRSKFGVLVFFVPVQQRSRHWTLCWVRWLDDPLELYLVRSAARSVSQPVIGRLVSPPVRTDRQRRQPPGSGLGYFDSITTGELENLLGK